jgi:hypothetical protein
VNEKKDGQDEVINYRIFAKYGFLITPLVILVTCGVLAVEFMILG